MKLVARGVAIAVVVIAVLASIGYIRLTRCDRALGVGVRTLTHAAAFESTCPNSTHFISYCTGQYGAPTWQSTAGFFDRYVLTMQIPIRINALGTSVVPEGSPVWQLVEVTSVQTSATGQKTMSYGRTFEFSGAHWQALVTASGKLDAVFPDLGTTEPVPGFKADLMGL